MALTPWRYTVVEKGSTPEGGPQPYAVADLRHIPLDRIAADLSGDVGVLVGHFLPRSEDPSQLQVATFNSAL
jgi:hypothetical protein